MNQYFHPDCDGGPTTGFCSSSCGEVYPFTEIDMTRLVTTIKDSSMDNPIPFDGDPLVVHNDAPGYIEDDRPWAQTYSGRVFPLVDPEPGEVYWPDVIFGVAHINRFAGQVGTYTVAQHNIVVGDQLPRPWRLYGLLHDAGEAYTNDLTQPMSRTIQWFCDGPGSGYGLGPAGRAIRKAKSGIDRAIYLAAGLQWPIPLEIENAIHVADMRAMMTERRDMMRKPPKSWGERCESVIPLTETIIPWRSPMIAVARYAMALGEAGLAGVPYPLAQM